MDRTAKQADDLARITAAKELVERGIGVKDAMAAQGYSVTDSRLRPIEWSQERVDRLIALQALGLSAASIAHDIGVSRSAVLGKVHRLRNRAARAA